MFVDKTAYGNYMLLCYTKLMKDNLKQVSCSEKQVQKDFPHFIIVYDVQFIQSNCTCLKVPKSKGSDT